MPSWLTNIQNKLPVSLQWLIPVAVTTIVKLVFPKIQAAFPEEASLIEDLAVYLTGGHVPQALRDAHAAYFASKKSERLNSEANAVAQTEEAKEQAKVA